MRLSRFRLALILASFLCIFLQTGSGSQDAASSAPAAPTRASWQRYNQRLSRISTPAGSLRDLLQPFLAYQFSLTRAQAQRGQVYAGPNVRLRRLLRRIMDPVQRKANANLTIAVVGTRVSWGAGASVRGRTDWASVLAASLRTAFPDLNVQVVNLTPGEGFTLYFAQRCLTTAAPPHADLVFMELALSEVPPTEFWDNGVLKLYEQLLRRGLGEPGGPAVVVLQVPRAGQGLPAGDAAKIQFHDTGEDMFGTLAQYYSIPWLSLRDALWVDAEGLRTPGGDFGLQGHGSASSASNSSGWAAVMAPPNREYPNDLGHKMLADLAMWLLQRSALELLLMPWGETDELAAGTSLPPPMHKANYEEPWSVPCQQLVPAY